jgi:hypothetical protein
MDGRAGRRSLEEEESVFQGNRSDAFPRKEESIMNRFAYLLPAALVVSLVGGPSAHAGSLTVQNKSGDSKVLKSALARNDDDTVNEEIFPDRVLESGEDDTLEFDSITKPKLKKSSWEPKSAGPMQVPTSTQVFTSVSIRDEWEYPIMYDTAAEPVDIEYSMTDAELDALDLANLGPGQIVTVVAGMDISGRFPPGVVFIDADTLLPFDGQLISEGLVLWGIPDVPTVSEWGLIVFALLLVTGGTLIIRRRLPRSPVVTPA